MRRHRFTILLVVVGLTSGGCASTMSKEKSEPPTTRVTTSVKQTGSNIGRRLEVAKTEGEPSAVESTKPKKKQTEASDEIVTRGGFR